MLSMGGCWLAYLLLCWMGAGVWLEARWDYLLLEVRFVTALYIYIYIYMGAAVAVAN